MRVPTARCSDRERTSPPSIGTAVTRSAGGFTPPAGAAGRSARAIALFIDGATDPDVSADGKPLIDDDFLIFVNAWWEPLTFRVPADWSGRPWEIVCDTFDPARLGPAAPPVEVGARSIVLLRALSND